MERFALSASLEVRPEKDAEVEALLQSARPLVFEEAGTMDWYALWHLDTIADEDRGRIAHLGDKVAKTFFARVNELFTDRPDISS